MDQSAASTRLRLRRDNGINVVGFLQAMPDGSAVRELYETTASLLDEPHVKMLVDFTGVTLVSSGLMGMMVTVKKKFLGVGGQLHLATIDPRIAQQFQIMNLHLILALFPSVEEAARSFKH